MVSELSAGSCTNITLHSDGTTKHDRSYTTFDIVNQEGKLVVCGRREVGAADAQSQLYLSYFVKSWTTFVAAWKIRIK